MKRTSARLGVRHLLLSAAALATSACSIPIGPDICDRPATPKPKRVCVGTVTGNTFSSLGRSGELLWFPGGAFYRINHGLGSTPLMPQAALSFDRFTNHDDGGSASNSLAQVGGNHFEVKNRTAEYLDVLNGTCIDAYLLVEASLPGNDEPPFQGRFDGCHHLDELLRDGE